MVRLIGFILLQILPLFLWVIARSKTTSFDFRLIASYFLFGSWFGMIGELFINSVSLAVFGAQIWEYRTFAMHDGATTQLGPIMWGLMAVYICFHKNYLPINKRFQTSIGIIASEAGYLMILELAYNFVGYLWFGNYIFYYFFPDLWHWSSLTAIPIWWGGYRVIDKAARTLNRQEKLNISLAVAVIVVLYTI